MVKGLASAVTTYANDFAAGKSLGGGSYIGTLANDGTGLAPFHDFDSKVPANVKTELDRDQGRHHQRQDRHHLAVGSEVAEQL